MILQKTRPSTCIGEEVILGHVSIVIGKKVLSKEEIKKILKISTEAKLTIVGIEYTDMDGDNGHNQIRQ